MRWWPLPLALLASVICSATPVPPSPWSALALRDLETMHALLEANHPGPVDGENGGFKDWLARGYTQALARARTVDSLGGYAATLAAFGEGFRDGHLGVWPSVKRERLSTPGFVVGLRGGDVVVRESRVKEVPAGATVTACDGVPVAELLRRDVYPFHQHGPDIEATRTQAAPWLFVDDDNPFRRRPLRCRVRGARGSGDIALAWRPEDGAEVTQAIQRAAFGPAPAAGIRPFGRDGVWVTIPQFYGDGDYEAYLKRVIGQAASWRDKQRVVFDLRGNTGGSSEWGARILGQLYGRARVDALDSAEDARIYVEWRVSAGNLEHMRKLRPSLVSQFGRESSIVKWVDEVASGLEQSLARKQPLWAQRSVPAPPASTPAPATPIPAAVFLLTDGRCGSACLDFVSLALPLPHVVHVGWPTSADSPYMEVRSEPLPSTLATVAFATKVYRNRSRSNQAYEPKQRFAGEIGDTAALERWVAELPLPPR